MAAKKKKAKKSAKKATKKKPAAKKATKKKAAEPKKAKSKKKRKPNVAFMKPLNPSTLLASIIGDSPVPRTEAVKKLWQYIKKNDLQDNINRRMINADEKLRGLFGAAQVSMFDIAKALKKHLK